LKYICHCGSENEISFEKFRKQKKGCSFCTKIGGYSHDEVYNYFKEKNCELISQYTCIKNKLKYICECGIESKISFDNFKNGKRCFECGKENSHNKIRNDIDEIKRFFIKNKCKPLFNEYKNNKTKLKYICSCGNESEITFSDFKRGTRCSECSIQRRLKTKQIKNNAPVSIQQKYIHSLFGGELNYQEGKSSLDIAFPNEKIYVEYDGGGHDLSVKLKSKTQKEFDEKEKRRRYALYRRGWKEIRIISRTDKLPTDIVLCQIFQYGINILNDFNYIVFDIDAGIIKYKDNIINYNYGKLKRFRNDYAS
jgi:very-short-patch-repair endonuclease